ncbi:hypothetical protein BJY52DRAFT_1301642 [Lactarius psammicola]|nr:hypothetical protein BJY52DRAFT_1301642 [Lactarius psammicola]
MLVSSKNFPQSTNSSTRHTLVLRHGSRNVLVLLPRTYQELLTITRSVFGMARSSAFVFETSDLDICQDIAVEIHPATWEAVALTVSSLVVKERNLGSSSRARGQRDNAALQHSRTIHGNSPITTRRAHDAPSGSSNEATQSDNGLTPATSYDDVPDSMPTDDFAEEELGSYDDDFEDTPAPPKGKGKAKASSRPRIESDEEDEYDDDGHADDAAAARGPGWFVPYPVQNTAIKADPSFSILPLSPPKRMGLPATSPQRLSVHAPVLFSPRVKSGVSNPAAPPVLSDEEQVEVRVPPTKPLRKPVQVVPDALSHTDGTSKEPTAPTSAALKDAQHEYPPQPKFNPQLKVPAQFAAAPAAAPTSAPAPAQTPAKAASQSTQPFDKILITIRHPPTEKENKFKVKSTHLVGRVLTSACAAFGLSPTGATLMEWMEEDGLETTSSCANDASMGSVAIDGSIFVIELAK